MKLHILSDLHIEFGKFDVPETDADVLVFAGDIGVGTGGMEWISSLNINKPMIYVLGNHEYYHHEIGLVDEIKALAPSHVHVLDKDTVEIEGVRFLGCTLWADFMLFGAEDRVFCMQYAKRGMADFSLISMNGNQFTPQDSIHIHENNRNWLQDALSIPYAGKTAVITHHFPSPKSIHPRFKEDMLTPAFGSDLEAIIQRDKVDLWVHGHTHDIFDYHVNGTRIVCNPRGYVGYESDRGFVPNLVIEI